MSRRTEIVSGPPGALVVKRATGDDADRLLEEARRLEAAAHPGVAELLSSSQTDDGWELRLAHGGRPLELAGALPAAEVGRIVAGLSATLADLHEAGIVHGRIDGSHVLIGGDGRAVLCGLGVDPVGATPADDVAALGTLLAGLLDASAHIEPNPTKRWTGRRSSNDRERLSLRLLADHARAEPPTRRPTARRLAAAIAEVVPSLETTTAARPADALRWSLVAHAASHRRQLTALAVALAAMLGLGAVGSRVGRIDHSSANAATTTKREVVVPSDVLAPRDSALPPTTTTTVSGVPVRVEGTTLIVGDRRYEVGEPGDLVVVGDWDCVGGVTPALLRPSTGEVFVFGSWPIAGEVSVRPAARVPGGAAPQVEPGAGGCSTLAVRRADGTRVAVPTGPVS